jgi:hypothetical protein
MSRTSSTVSSPVNTSRTSVSGASSVAAVLTTNDTLMSLCA